MGGMLELNSAESYIREMYIRLNDTFFDSELPLPEIVVDREQRLYFRTNATIDKECKVFMNEEVCGLPTELIVGNLVHVMVHILCRLSGLDVSGGDCVNHNIAFNKEALRHGLTREKVGGVRYHHMCCPNEELKYFAKDEVWFEGIEQFKKVKQVEVSNGNIGVAVKLVDKLSLVWGTLTAEEQNFVKQLTKQKFLWK